MNHPPSYREIDPPAALRAFVECLWFHDVAAGDDQAGRRLLPSGRANLVWVPNHSLHVSGPQSRFTRGMPVAGMRVLGARFRPGAVRSLVGIPAAEYTDTHLPLEAFDTRLAARLDARLGGSRDTRSALTTLAAELVRVLADGPAPDPVVAAAVRVLDRRGASVAAAAAHVNLSERALQRRFGDEVGYGPKTLQRVLRFRRFLDVVSRVELAGAAALAGYADQSHLTREATRLAGLTPLQLRTFQH